MIDDSLYCLIELLYFREKLVLIKMIALTVQLL